MWQNPVNMSSGIPISLYIHIPWCEQKCPYCDFNSHTQKQKTDEQTYIQALLQDLDLDITKYKEHLKQREILSIFIGGGTPSLFSEHAISELLEGIKQRLNLSSNAEITLEANPGSSEAKKFTSFRQAGINRLSIGIQSFNLVHLKTLGRIHNNKEAINAAGYAKKAGFDNFNLDIMFGLPKQSIEQSIDDVTQAIELQPSHLSCYQLTIEPNTLFHHNPPITPDHDTLWLMQNELQKVLTTHNYKQYEVSAYAQPNRQCKHNLNYWQFGDYLAIGAGAHGKITLENGDIQRYWKIKHPTQYLKYANTEKRIGETKTIDQKDIAFEFMLNALRLNEGFSEQIFTKHTNLDISSIKPVLHKHQQQGLIAIQQNHIQSTDKGYQFLNSMLQDYLDA